MIKKMMIFTLLLIIPYITYAGEIEFTGKATVIKDDTRTAQRNSLNNALLGGIRRYIQINAPERKADITEDYLMFISEYQILNRELVGNAVVTKVKLTMNDLILEDVATHVTRQVNTAVFLITGLPDYVDEGKARKLTSAHFAEKQFSTKDQIAFEQEIIDRNDRNDILTAFQSVSAQYYFQFKVLVKDYKAGENCTIQSDASLVSTNKLYTITPILRSNVTAEAEDAADCILLALSSAVEAALTHTRVKLIPSPGTPLELLKYEMKFTGVTNLKSINSVIDSISKRKLIKSSSMEEFFDGEAIFMIEAYFTPDELVKRISEIGIESITKVEVDDESVKITIE